MPRLFVLSGPDVGRVFDVESGAKLGRASDCDVQLTHSSISRHHALLERDERGWCVVDTGSVNGVVFGGGRVGRAPLSDGAVFALGEVELRFRALVEVTGADVDLDLTQTTLAPRPDGALARAIERDEIVLEAPDEIELEHSPASAAQARPPARRAPARPAPARATPSRAAVARAQAGARGSSVAAAGERGILQYQRVPDRAGFFASDLAQQPTWVRLAVTLVALVLFAALGFGAWRGVLLLRGRAQPDALELETSNG